MTLAEPDAAWVEKKGARVWSGQLRHCRAPARTAGPCTGCINGRLTHDARQAR